MKYYLPLIALLFTCCTEKNPVISYQWDRVDSVSTITLKADSSLIGGFRLTYWDGHVIVKDLSKANNKLYKIFQVKSDSLIYKSSFMGFGRGPYETLGADFKIFDNAAFITTDPMQVTVSNMYKVTDVALLDDTKNYLPIPVPSGNEFDRIAPIDTNGEGDDFVVSFAGFKHKAMFGIFNSRDTSTVELEWKYPEKYKSFPSYILSNIYTGTLNKRPFNNEYVYSTQEGNHVFTFNIKSGQITDYHEIYSTHPDATITPDGNDVKYNRPDGIYGYDVSVSQNYIYLLKRSLNKNNDVGQIDVFDWDGSPVRRIILDRNIERISVDDNDSLIYGSARFTGDSELILKCKLR